jgi:hypothetical protein
MSATVASYLMNPAEDVVLFGEEITEGMWVLPEGGLLRRVFSGTEEERLRAQRFRKVTRLRRVPVEPGNNILVFIGEWVDGYQEVCRYNESYGWIVKKDSLPGAAS